MRILYITNAVSGPGGLERVLSIKASYFADALEYDIHILTTNDPQNTTFFKFSDKIQFHKSKTNSSFVGYLLNFYKDVNKEINKINPTIIIVCDDGLKGLLFPFFIKKDRPMIYERHVSKMAVLGYSSNTFFNRIKVKFIKTLMDWGARKYDAFVVLTNGNAKEWSLKNIKIIPNPLPFEGENNQDHKENIVIAVGKHSYQKGYDSLVRSWKDVAGRAKDWQLHIYGSYNKFCDVSGLIKECDVEDSVKLFPPTKEIREKLDSASLHVLSSRYEGFGMVIIEAMACGLPSVSFDCPFGPSDIIKDGFNGILVENGNEQKLAAALYQLIADKEKRLLMGNNAHASIEKYHIQNIGSLWRTLFDELTPQSLSKTDTTEYAK